MGSDMGGYTPESADFLSLRSFLMCQSVNDWSMYERAHRTLIFDAGLLLDSMSFPVKAGESDII